MAKKLKYLITGGLGFIGHNLVKQLQKEKNDVQVIDALTTYAVHSKEELEDLYNQRLKQVNNKTQIYKEDICTPEVDQIFANFNPDVVIHLADFPNASTVATNAVEAARTMCQGLVNLLDCAKRHTVKKFVYISTGIYEDKTNVDGQYSIWKIAGEELVKQSAIAHVIIRPGTVYGPRNISTDIIGTMFKKAIEKDILYANNTKHDLIYVDDCVKGIVQASMAENKTYNISLSQSISEKDIANNIINIVKHGTVKLQQEHELQDNQLDCSESHKEIKFNPKIDIEKGLKLYHNWISTKK